MEKNQYYCIEDYRKIKWASTSVSQPHQNIYFKLVKRLIYALKILSILQCYKEQDIPFLFFLSDFFLLTGHRGIALGHSPFSLHPPTTNICCKSATPKPNCLQLTQKAIKKLFLCSSWKERQPDVWLVDPALFWPLSVGRTAAEEGSQQVVLMKVNIAKKELTIFFMEEKDMWKSFFY